MRRKAATQHDFEFEDIGEQELKNIGPNRVYRLKPMLARQKRRNSLRAAFSAVELSKTMSNPKYEDDLPRLDRHFQRAAIIQRETIIVVIGHSVTNELLDRPVAERLRDQIDQRGGGREFPYRRAIVITDQGWYDEARDLPNNAVIALGGPQANKLSLEFDTWVAPPSSGGGKYPIRGTEALTGFSAGTQINIHRSAYGEKPLVEHEKLLNIICRPRRV